MVMKMKHYLLPFLMGVAMCVSSVPKNVTTVTKAQLHNLVYGPKGYYSTVFSGIYYIGSDQEFHFFAIKYRRIKTDYFKIALSDYPIEKTFKVTKSESEWVSYTDKFPFPEKK